MPAIRCLLKYLFSCRIKREAQNKHVDEVVQERAKVSLETSACYNLQLYN